MQTPARDQVVGEVIVHEHAVREHSECPGDQREDGEHPRKRAAQEGRLGGRG
jgi:hypothetical protein